MGGSKAVWNFSKKSSDLVARPFLYPLTESQDESSWDRIFQGMGGTNEYLASVGDEI